MSASTPCRPGRRPDPKLRALWEKRLCHFEQSGLAASTFCSNHGLSLPSFYAWRRRLRCSHPASTPSAAPAAEAEPRFVPISLLPAPTPIELVLPTGTVVRVPPGCDLAFVRSLLESLGGAPC
jgi:transposase